MHLGHSWRATRWQGMCLISTQVPDGIVIPIEACHGVSMKRVMPVLLLLLYAISSSAQSPGYGSGFSSTGLTLNGKAAISGTNLELTNSGTGEAGSAFFNTPVNVQAFTNTFKFQVTSGSNTADGFTFTIQNNSPAALGTTGGGLGYGSNSAGTGGIPNSVAVKFDLYSNAGEGTDSTGLFTNGMRPTVPATDMTSSGVDLHSGDAFSVTMTYNGTTLALRITDTVTNATFSTNFTVNIPAVVGANTAFVGFTGGTGGLTATQNILNWTYTPTGGPPTAPSITTQPSNQTVAVGQMATFSVVAAGTAPLTYEWQKNNVIISGSNSASYTTPATTSTDNGSAFHVTVTNSAGNVTSNTATLTVTSSPTSPSYGGGFTSSGLALNGGAALSGTRLRLTDGGSGEARSAFFNIPVNVQSFTNNFTFQLTNPNADGFTFTIQNNSPTALGAGGGSLGYGPNGSGGGIPNSVAVKFDLYSNAGEGSDSTGLYTEGASPTVPATDLTSSGVNLHSGDTFKVAMDYNGTTLSMQITDTATSATFSTSFTMNIPSVVGGNTAYVGFTGGTGGLTATQDILTWTYTPTTQGPPTAPSITTQPSSQTVNVGQAATFAVVASGTAPLIYQWQKNTGSGFANISSATSASYTSPPTTSADSGTTFQVIVSNSVGKVTSNAATLTVTSGPTNPSYGGGFTSSGLVLNGGAALSGTRLRLTDGGSGEARSAFFSTPINVQSFITDFTFQLTNPSADGFTFTVQNNSPTALGVGGGSLGYGPNGSSGGGIPNSVAVKFDLYSNAGEGSDSTGLYTEGASPTVPATDLTSSGVNLHSGDVMTAHLAYDGSTMTLVITDTNTNASFAARFTVNIPGAVGGNTGYVGFTGGTGGLSAIQDILNWTYDAVPVTAFAWPVGTPITYANGSSGGPNDYSTYDGPAPIFGSYHTGIDVCPQSPGCAVGDPVYASSSGIVELALVVSDSTGTLCDGRSTAGYKINPNTSNLGNVVVIAHPNGKFSLYGHMDCIWPGIVPGSQVSTGTRIGNMGHSEFGARHGTFTPHTHFEMKDRAVTGDPTNKGYSGYVPDLPDGYGYHDARIYINPFSTTTISATAIKIVASSNQNVLTGPATGFSFLATVAPGQEFVAFASSGSWYRVYLPNDNAPISGWIEASSGAQTFATPDSTATQLQVTGTGGSGLSIQAAASSGTDLVSWDQTFSDCASTSKIWDGQRYVGLGSQNGFNEFYLPSNYYFNSANSCAEPSGLGPSVGWASAASLH
jgi:hypothetical protein